MTFLFTLSILSQGPTGKGVNVLSGVIDPNYHEKEPKLLPYKMLEIGLEVSLGGFTPRKRSIVATTALEGQENYGSIPLETKIFFTPASK